MPNELWDWEKRVPDDLIPAVQHVRNLFEDARWKSGTVTQHCCYTLLHPNEKASDDIGQFTSALVTLKAFIGQNSTQFFHDLLKRETPSAILAAFFHFYKSAMAVQVKSAFRDLLAIGSANVARLETPAIEWAEWQVKSIINSASYQTGLWLKRCCDVDTYDLGDGYDPNAGEEDERVWTSWRAPRFVGMEPSLGRPFEASRVWEREDVESSQSVVKAFKKYFVIHLEARLKECVGSAHLEFAKQPKTTALIGIQRPSETPAGGERKQSQCETPRIEQVGAAASKFDWKELETRFRDIQARTTSSQDVFASWTRTERSPGFIEEEWELRGPVYWWSEFVELASIAAQKLGYPPGENANKNWLGQIGKWMQKRGLDKDKNVGWCPDGSGSDGTIRHMFTQKIAELSADFCLHLSPRESAVSPLVERSATGGSRAASSSARNELHGSHQNPIPGSATQPASTKTQMREALLKRAEGAPMGTTFRYADAATIFDVSEKTIRNWLDEGKLDKGAKRGNITAESVKRRLGFPV